MNLSTVQVIIEGKPMAQGRARARAQKKGDKVFAQIYEPGESKAWKEYAHGRLIEALPGHKPFEGPVQVMVLALFPLAQSKWKKTKPVARAWHTSRPDIDNVVKILLDAANGVVYKDDRQVCILTIQKQVCAQGEPPCIELYAEAVEGPPLWPGNVIRKGTCDESDHKEYCGTAYMRRGVRT